MSDNPLIPDGLTNVLSGIGGDAAARLASQVGGYARPWPSSVSLDDRVLPISEFELPSIGWSWHQLVVIGNGFDLECGLPSSFSDFAKDRDKKLALQNDRLEPNELRSDYTETVWDVILNDADGSSWSDVEGTIADWIVPKTDSDGVVQKDRVAEVLACLKSQALPEGLNSTDLLAYSVAEHIKGRLGGTAEEWGRADILDFFRSELSVLERDFSSYLSSAVEATRGYREKAQELIFTLLNEKCPRELDLDIEESVLSFNYTRFANTLRAGDHNIGYVNVHGELGREIVFGIDGTGLLSDSDLAPFTKTFRIMGLDLPDAITLVRRQSETLHDDGTALIKFYGHSLGEADYSYFQAMFDTVGLYEGNTRLVFYYRPYDKVDEPTARRMMMDKATRLLSAYGETLDNKDHGKNLIHKLLLERRLSVELLPEGRIRRG